MCLRGKFRAMIHISNETRSTKYPKIGHIRLVTSDKLMRSFLQELMKVNLVDDMAGVLIALAQNLIGVLYSASIVLAISIRVRFFLSTTPFRCSWEFMSQAIFIKKFFDMSIFVFCTIITSDMLER